MSNPIFIYEGLESATLTASAGSDAGYPLTNLQDRRYATIWKSNANTDEQTLKAYFPAGKTVDTIFVANHNMGLAVGVPPGAVYLEHSWDGAEWTTVGPLSTADPSYTTFVADLYPYWRLRWHKGSALGAAPQIGMLFIGARADMPLYLNEPERGLESDAEVEESLSGLLYGSSIRADRERWSLAWGGTKVAEAAAFFGLVRGVNGQEKPFWFCDMDGNWHFVRFAVNYLPLIGRGNVMFGVQTVELMEERVGIAMNLPGNQTVPAV
jgi:hypothetical protein